MLAKLEASARAILASGWAGLEGAIVFFTRATTDIYCDVPYGLLTDAVAGCAGLCAVRVARAVACKTRKGIVVAQGPRAPREAARGRV